MTSAIINGAGLVAVAAVFGGMAFFAFVYAPLVFIKLGTEAGGRFIREVFPVYYLAMGAVSVAAAALLGVASVPRGIDTMTMACTGIVFLLARFVLLPVINRSRDAGQAGRRRGAEALRPAAPAERRGEPRTDAGGAGRARAVRGQLTPHGTNLLPAVRARKHCGCRLGGGMHPTFRTTARQPEVIRPHRIDRGCFHLSVSPNEGPKSP